MPTPSEAVLARLGIEVVDTADRDVVALLGSPGRDGQPRSTRGNVAAILRNDPRWRGRLRYDEFLDEPVCDGVKLTDHDLYRIGDWIERVYGPSPSTALICEAIILVAKERPVHRVRDYLRSLTWDGVPRLNGVATEVLGSEDTELNRTMCRKFLLSAVARVMEPGCKADTMLVLVGPQGAGKSTFCEALLPEPTWFAETPVKLGDKDAYLALQGKWLYEVAEMEGFKGRNNAAAKAFLSAKVDRYRTPYGKLCQDHPRQLVLIGTSNSPEVLSDSTGGRRYWVLQVGKVDVERVVRDRDQLWAEALHHYDAGEQWWLPEHLERQRRETEADFRQVDVFLETLESWVSKRTAPFTTNDALVMGLGVPLDRVNRALETRLGKLLRELGCTKQRQRDGVARKHLWYPRPLNPTG
jgi:putative DNA primase/helicase